VPSSLRVSYLLDGFAVGGTELNFVRVLEALSARDIRLDVLHLQADGELRDRVSNAGHRLTHVPVRSLKSVTTLGTLSRIMRALHTQQTRVVHTQDVYSNILGVPAARCVGRSVISSRRWLDDVPRPGLARLNAWCHRRSDVVLTNTAAVVPRLTEEGVANQRIRTIPNFLSAASTKLLSHDERLAWRSRLGVPVSARVVGVVARLSRVKRHADLLSAWAPLALANPDMHLLLIGDGDLRDSLQSQVESLGVRQQVTFAGALPQTPFPHQLFDVAALTSENEAFPNSLVEAAACAVPSVATLVGGVADVVRHGVTGLTVAAGDIGAIQRALHDLLSDRGRRIAMGMAAQDLALGVFGEHAVIERLVQLYRELGA
jgi:L-malate glycosyltransferase